LLAQRHGQWRAASGGAAREALAQVAIFSTFVERTKRHSQRLAALPRTHGKDAEARGLHHRNHLWRTPEGNGVASRLRGAGERNEWIEVPESAYECEEDAHSVGAAPASESVPIPIQLSHSALTRSPKSGS
jgi:hypothetical protein